MDIPNTTFRTQYGHYEFLVRPSHECSSCIYEPYESALLTMLLRKSALSKWTEISKRVLINLNPY
ncbi:hypothetical protein EPI10_016386 [Gossypium australe]|uniref:Uncharacterized protein n=1 Tax=Gossypium australe TaxID=47621 RepID=A0A5B6VNX8_9ROSI|nr:hypothetical protein EPI10_016386 [Gossypium australe]